ncbi:MAG: amidoligase family protein [Candidatus Hatepunaea meridiana]|nr:amidoligase family protein [Candidatus Hatepunaea meridiana]
MITIQEQKFGVEIEVAGVARHLIAEAVAEGTGGRITATHCTGYDTTIVTDQQEREWKIMNDGSIPYANGHRGSEIVTPILEYTDIEMLQQVVRKVRATGAIANRSCTAIHIHVDGRQHTVKSLSILAKMVYKNEDMIFDALQVHPERRRRYTQPMDEEFIDKVVKRRPRSDRRLNEYWFGRYNPHPEHYNSQRYHGFNLSCKWRYLNTIEWRYPNSTLHSGKIKAYIQLFLALSAKALNARAASHRKIPTDNPKFNFRVWLVSTLGMKGNEFKTARYHLTRYLPGNSAWRYGRPTN